MTILSKIGVNNFDFLANNDASFQVLACFLATAAALEDTQDVKMAKAKFFKAFNAAKKGELTYLQAPLIPVVAAKPYLMDSAAVIAAKPYLMDSAAVAAAKPYLMDSPAVAAAKPYLADSAAVAAAKPYMMDTAEVAAAKPYLMDSAAVAAAKPYMMDSPAVAAAKPYLADSAAVAAAKPYMMDTAEVAAAKPYLADSAAVAAAKPYLADTQEVAAAKADFKKYFDAREMGIPATPGFLEPIQVKCGLFGNQFYIVQCQLDIHKALQKLVPRFLSLIY